MRKALDLAVILTAQDRMTAVFEKASKSSQGYLERLQGSRGFQAMDELGSKAMVAGTAITGAFGLAVKSAADMERMQIALNTSFQGNEKAAKDAFDTISMFAAKTPFQMNEVMGGFIKLKNMGLDPSMEALTAYGNTAAAMGKSLNDMVEAVADAATGEFERLKEFGIRASSQGEKVTFTFQGVKTTVGKNSAEIESYLKKIGLTKFAGGIEAQSKSLSGQFSTFQDNVQMAAASVGRLFIPRLNELMGRITPMIERMQKWAEANPDIVKGIAAAGVALLAFGVTVKLITGAVALFNAVSALNPWVLVAGAVVAAALLIYKYWGPISEWFRALWEKVKGVFNRFVNFAKNLLMNFTPVGIIYKYWGPITDWFSGMWEKVKGIFNAWMEWVFLWPTKLVEVGGAIVDNIKAGISRKWDSFKGWFKDKLQGLRDFLPFSPAKTGPLKDIHRLRFVETIAQSIKPGPMINAMRGVTAAMAVAAPMMVQPASAAIGARSGGGAGVTVQYSPTINLPAGTTASQAQDFMAMMRQNQGELLRLIEGAMERRNRIKY